MLKCFGVVEKMHVWKENNPLLFFCERANAC